MQTSLVERLRRAAIEASEPGSAGWAALLGKATMPRSSSLRTEFAPPAAPALFSQERPVDLVHLSHQTMGDVLLEREVLGLLARQILSFARRLDLAQTEERRRVAHALKGASLNVGAFRLAKAAAALEGDPDDEAALEDFESEMARAGTFIADLLKSAAD